MISHRDESRVFSLLSCRADKNQCDHPYPAGHILFWRSDSKKSGKEIVQKYRSTVETDPSIIYIIFFDINYTTHITKIRAVNPNYIFGTVIMVFMEAFQFYEIGTE